MIITVFPIIILMRVAISSFNVHAKIIFMYNFLLDLNLAAMPHLHSLQQLWRQLVVETVVVLLNCLLNCLSCIVTLLQFNRARLQTRARVFGWSVRADTRARTRWNQLLLDYQGRLRRVQQTAVFQLFQGS